MEMGMLPGHDRGRSPAARSGESRSPAGLRLTKEQAMTTATPAEQSLTYSTLDHLQELEAESMHIIREVVGELDRPALLFSGGKDSIVMLHLALKAFYPSKLPFPVLHIDTGHNFPEVIAYRDQAVARTGVRLIVRTVEDAITRGRVVEAPGAAPNRNIAQIPTLLDEERARAKERVFSIRSELGRWEPRDQRPELWDLYNARVRKPGPSGDGGEHIRVFPLSNWTELDVWEYILAEGIPIPTIYLAHERDIVMRSGRPCPVSDFFPAKNGERVERKTVRFRTVGDMTCTAATESTAATVADVIDETRSSRQSERGSRMDDTVSDAAMEDRKREGYF
jgi:sulfate adenylyltransferase subunit 2